MQEEGCKVRPRAPQVLFSGIPWSWSSGDVMRLPKSSSLSLLPKGFEYQARAPSAIFAANGVACVPATLASVPPPTLNASAAYLSTAVGTSVYK
jgi:hypothetical protein